ncbi:MAG: substrate-binding domain-containing protein [Campylobacterales bacterium]
MKNITIFVLFLIFTLSLQADSNKKLAYLVSDMSIPFWQIMSKGIVKASEKNGYSVKIYNAKNSAKQELINTVEALKSKIDGLIISPTSSSSSATILKLAEKANIPVVISDIGTDSGEYVSFISSNNKQGAYDIGRVLAEKMNSLGWDKDGTVGIIAIPQKRLNGQQRTAGFMKAMDEANIDGAGIKQQIDFSYQETYNYTKELINENKNLRAIWLQGSDKYEGALDAIKDSGKSGEILLICFDAEPVFLELIPKDVIVGAAMQQPYLMGKKSVEVMLNHLENKTVNKNIELEVLAVSGKNIKELLPVIKKNVLGLEAESE